MEGKSNVRSRRRGASPSERIIIRCLEVFWIDQEQIICTECVRVVFAPHSNTTNLFDHLKNHHKPQYDECIKAKANVNSLNLRPCPTSTQKNITATLHRASIHLPKTHWNNRYNRILFGQRHVSNKYCEQWRRQKNGQDTRQEIRDPLAQLFLQQALPALYEKRRGGNTKGCHSCRVFCDYDWPMVKQNNGAIHVPDNSLHKR